MVSKIVLPDNTVLSGRYQIERVIGQGGFGITYYARHLELGTHVAIKEFFLSGMCTREQNGMVGIQDISPEKFEQFRKRFREEAHTLCQLSNSHVVAVRDIFDENGTTYIVMDYVAGETLQKKVEREGALQYDVAVNYMAQLCEAVEHIHAHHILHRDIKPENIIITPQNNVVLIDFGSARSFVHDKEQKHTAMLTMGYAPIEQYTATSKKGNYTDLYAVGGTFYFILTGRKPIPAADRMLNDELQPPRTFNLAVPESASRTIMKALNLKPEDRYQAVADFKRDLLEGGTTQAPQIPTGGSTYTTPPKTDNTVPIVVLSVIGALILCLAL
jgi:serine/threonine-protein kinase